MKDQFLLLYWEISGCCASLERHPRSSGKLLSWDENWFAYRSFEMKLHFLPIPLLPKKVAVWGFSFSKFPFLPPKVLTAGEKCLVSSLKLANFQVLIVATHFQVCIKRTFHMLLFSDIPFCMFVKWCKRRFCLFVRANMEAIFRLALVNLFPHYNLKVHTIRKILLHVQVPI